ncbi:MAG TPA: hypothetical protein VJL90_15945 [Pseudorhodoplanes sp.]|nr:hypothetical protein [Pseudorhodoplanes sp.]
MTHRNSHGLCKLAGYAVASFALSLWTNAALAEVCDKAAGGENWRQDHGPVWLLNPVGGIPYTLLILILGLLLAKRFRWIGYVAAFMLAANAAILIFADLVPEHDIYLMQIREGCRSYRTDLMNLGLISIFVIAYAWFGYRAARDARSPKPAS